MKPDIKDYKILNLNQTYFVLDPYDLYIMPCVSLAGRGYQEIEDAKRYREFLYESHIEQYERLQKMGRSFPDND